MAFDINEFKSQIGQGGFQRNTHFACSITPPPALGSAPFARDLPFRVSSANMPGVILGTDDFKVKGYGLNESRPISVGYEDVTLTVVADASGQAYDFFHNWFELIFPTDPEGVGSEATEFYEYPVNYYGGLELYVYDMTGKKHTTFTFVNPYVANLGAVQMGWENVDSLMLIPISFKYRTYKKNSSYSGAIVNNAGVSPAAVENILI